METLKKITQLSILGLLLLVMFTTPSFAQSEAQYYYHEKMVKNGTFIWNVTHSYEYYEDIPEGAQFSVKLRDSLYPGPLTEGELTSIYATIKVDGDKYTGNGFPLFWHIRKVNGTVETSIQEDFESEPTLFNVSDVTGSIFNVNFTIVDDQYSLFVDMDIDGTEGLTIRYFENLTDGVDLESSIELTYESYAVEAPLNFVWAFLGLFTTAIVLVIVKRKKK